MPCFTLLYFFWGERAEEAQPSCLRGLLPVACIRRDTRVRLSSLALPGDGGVGETRRRRGFGGSACSRAEFPLLACFFSLPRLPERGPFTLHPKAPSNPCASLTVLGNPPNPSHSLDYTCSRLS